MSMGKRGPVQGELFVSADRLQSPGHPFYKRLNQVLERHGFDQRLEELCRPYYADRDGRPSVPPGVYFRMLLVGYFEGIGSERAIAWRCQDSLSLKEFLGLGPSEAVPEHSSLSRIRQRLDASVFKGFQKLILSMLKPAGMLKGRQLALDTTLLQADAAMSTIVKRDTNESYPGYVKRLARAAGERPSRAGRSRFDKKRKGRTTSNKDWSSPTDPEAKVAKLKDGRTKLAYKPEHAVDLESGAIVAVTMNAADVDDRKTMLETFVELEKNLNAFGQTTAGATLVADKGYYSTEVLSGCVAVELKPCIAEPELRTRRRWKGREPLARTSCYQNRKRIRSARGRRLMRRRAEIVERSFEHVCSRGGIRRTRLRGLENNEKRYVAQVTGFNLGLLMRKLFGAGTPKALAGLVGLVSALVNRLIGRQGRPEVDQVPRRPSSSHTPQCHAPPRVSSRVARRRRFSTGC